MSLCCFFTSVSCLLYIVGAFPPSFPNTRYSGLTRSNHSPRFARRRKLILQTQDLGTFDFCMGRDGIYLMVPFSLPDSRVLPLFCCLCQFQRLPVLPFHPECSNANLFACIHRSSRHSSHEAPHSISYSKSRVVRRPLRRDERPRAAALAIEGVSSSSSQDSRTSGTDFRE